MASKKFSADILSVKSTEKLKKELQEYRDSLEYKCEKMVEELCKLGEKVALEKIGESPLGKTITIRSERTPEEMGCGAVIIAVGEVKQSEGYAPFNTLLAVEFGAGIRYNKIENPKADEFEMGVGTFPGQIHAFQNEGWMYWDEKNKKWKHSYGVKATMPMYSATVELIREYQSIAKKIFSNKE